LKIVIKVKFSNLYYCFI